MEAINDLTPNALLIVVVYIIIRDVVVPLVKKRNGTGEVKPSTVEQIAQQINELHRMHDQRDGDGRLVWYNPVGLKTALIDLNTNTAKLTVQIKALVNHYKNGGK